MNQSKLAFLAGISSGIIISLIWKKIQSKQQVKQIMNNSQKEQNQYENEQNLLQEQLIRNIQFFGNEGQQKIEQSNIIIFGAGGVGSHVISAFARAGVKQITIVDFDRVTLSSLNRHAFATRKDVGKSKVEIFKEFIKDLNPTIQLNIIDDYLKPENIQTFFTNIQPDYVVDCIDNIDAKISLIQYCVQNKIKIIVCCGAGMKCDPTRIQIRDIKESQNDDLAKALRMRLKKLDIREGFKVLYSTELSEKKLLPLQEHQKENPDQFRVMPNYRLRIVPVFGCMPALFAQSLAAYVLCDLAGCPPVTFCQNDIKMPYFIQQFQLLGQQAKKNKVELEIDVEDLVIIYKANKAKCLIKNSKVRPLSFIQYIKSQNITPQNIILLSPENAKLFQEEKITLNQDQIERKKIIDKEIEQNLYSRVFV